MARYVESEPEVWALARYFESLGNVVGAIDIHSYSQYILRPWTHVNTVPPHEAEHAEASLRVVCAFPLGNNS